MFSTEIQKHLSQIPLSHLHILTGHSFSNRNFGSVNVPNWSDRYGVSPLFSLEKGFLPVSSLQIHMHEKGTKLHILRCNVFLIPYKLPCKDDV
jgi:hypothetical protein